MLSLVAATAASVALVQSEWHAIARATPGRVGAVAYCLETEAQVKLLEREAFPAQSVVKLPIAIAAMEAARKQGRAFGHPVPLQAADFPTSPYPSPTRDAYRAGRKALPLTDLVGHACRVSDNAAANVLLRVAGGPESVVSAMHGLGLVGLSVGTGFAPFVPADNTMTPATAARMLAAVWRDEGVSREAGAVLRQAMAACETGPNRLPGLLPTGVRVAHKTGSSLTVGGVTAATNDVGVLTLTNGDHVVLAAFVADVQGPEALAERTIARLAAAICKHWSKPRPSIDPNNPAPLPSGWRRRFG